MFSQYFGHYLLNKGIVKPEHLKDALDFQHSARLKLGVLAINFGYMSADQVMEVHQKQTELDKKFGELAVQLGYLTPEQLEELLSAQNFGHLLLGQVLVDMKYLTLEQLQEALNEYKKDYSLSEEQFYALQHDDIDLIVDTFVSFEDSPLSQVYKDYISLLMRNIVRFLGDSPRVVAGAMPGEYSAKWLVYQQIYGGIDLFTAIAADEKMFLEIGRKYAGEDFKEPDELAQASVAEFLNLHNGIFLVNMSNNGIELDLKPQGILSGQILTGLQTGYVIPFYLSSGKLDLIIYGAHQHEVFGG